MGRDESGTVARLLEHLNRRFAPAAARYGGRVIRLTGDGGLAEFPSAVDALGAAIEFQQAMIEANREQPEEKAIVFRIGLHLGDVIVEGDDIYGDDVNVAARLEAEAPPGGIVVSRAVREAVAGRLKVSLHTLGDLTLKNIERPIRAFRVEWSAADWPASQAVSAPAGASLQHTAPESPPRLSIVVLPFANIGGDPAQEYFADGVTESLTTDLSRMGGMLVIGRHTAFTYKGKHVDLKQIGRELGVRYVLEGSVQRGSNRMRVTAQLVDAETGNSLWAERFDKPLTDLFDMQDEIVTRLARQLGTKLVATEAGRSERRPNPDSLDLRFQGLAWFYKGRDPEDLARAGVFFERALALDPGNIGALGGGAAVNVVSAISNITNDRYERLAAAEAALSKVLSVAPNMAEAHHLMGVVQIFTNRVAQGISECERALALDRNVAGAHADIGFAKLCVGRAEETEVHIQEALRLSPRDSQAYVWMLIAGAAKLFLGSDEEAIAWLRRSVEANRNNPNAHFYLAAALAHLGWLEEARAAAQAGLALNPTFTVLRHQAGAFSDNPIYLAQRERVSEGIRKAGVPEGDRIESSPQQA